MIQKVKCILTAKWGHTTDKHRKNVRRTIEVLVGFIHANICKIVSHGFIGVVNSMFSSSLTISLVIFIR